MLSTTDAAEHYLLRRQFQQAQATARTALQQLQRPATPFQVSTSTAPPLSKNLSLVSLRPYQVNDSVSLSASTHLDQLVRLCAVWMQATAELQHLHTTETHHHHRNPPLPASPLLPPSTPPPPPLPLLPDVTFIPNLVQLHLPSSPTLPYLTSIVWLTYLAKVGAIEQAKEAILGYLCSSEGRLYTQAHWRAVTASLGQQPSAENTRDAQSRYEHLVEVLLLDVLVPLGDDATALEFVNKDISLSAERRQSLRQIVRGQWNATTVAVPPSKSTEQENDVAHTTLRGQDNGRVHRGKSRDAATPRLLQGTALGQLASTSKTKLLNKKRTERKEKKVEQGLTREDVEVLCGGAAAVAAFGLAAWVAWKKRRQLAARFQSISGFLS